MTRCIVSHDGKFLTAGSQWTSNREFAYVYETYEAAQAAAARFDFTVNIEKW